MVALFPDYWKCPDGSRCLIYYHVCTDRGGQCRDGGDEDVDFCSTYKCASDWMKCANHKCVPKWNWCDGREHCSDGSDEWNCTAENHACPDGYFKCKTQLKCIMNQRVCDGNAHHEPYVNDCNDLSDEDPELCKTWQCPDDYWKCRDDSKCIYQNKISNGMIDCPDGSDENLIFHQNRTCPDNWFKCKDGFQCIRQDSTCLGKLYNYFGSNCLDLSDESEELCTDLCDKDYFLCANGYQCIYTGGMCRSDIDAQCDDRSDLSNRICPCGEGEWPCKDGNGCLKGNLVCDGVAHCNDESDELEEVCLNWNCTGGMWKCENNQRCISMHDICDSNTQCTDESDEQDCGNYTCVEGKS